MPGFAVYPNNQGYGALCVETNLQTLSKDGILNMDFSRFWRGEPVKKGRQMEKAILIIAVMICGGFQCLSCQL